MNYLRPNRKKKLRVWVRDKFKCQLKISPYCIPDLTIDNATVDHTKAVSKGGTNDENNLVTACQPCNNLKGDRSREYFVSYPVTKEDIRLPRKQRLKEKTKKIIKVLNKKHKKSSWRVAGKNNGRTFNEIMFDLDQ